MAIHGAELQIERERDRDEDSREVESCDWCGHVVAAQREETTTY